MFDFGKASCLVRFPFSLLEEMEQLVSYPKTSHWPCNHRPLLNSENARFLVAVHGGKPESMISIALYPTRDHTCFGRLRF